MNSVASRAAGLSLDTEAVQAAITQPWSTSPVEGQINRLKTIKRQMSGRAVYPLPRSRYGLTRPDKGTPEETVAAPNIRKNPD